MDNFQPAHFIEQFNPNEEHKEYAPKKFLFSEAPIEFLQDCLDFTKALENHHTVAVFKIMLKKKD